MTKQNSGPVPIPIQEHEVYEKLRLIETGQARGTIAIILFLNPNANPADIISYTGKPGKIVNDSVMNIVETREVYENFVAVLNNIPRSLIKRIEYAFIPHMTLT